MYISQKSPAPSTETLFFELIHLHPVKENGEII